MISTIEIRGVFMKKPVDFLCIAAAVCMLMFVSTAYSQTGTEGRNPGELVMKACSACHDTGKVCTALGKKNRDAWLAAVNRMVKKGAAVDQADVPLVADYLAGLTSGSKPVSK
jgi:cytochrome c5